MVEIRAFRKEDTREVASLFYRTMRKFNSKDYFKKSAVKEFIDYYNPEKHPLPRLIRRFKATPIFYVAEQDGKILGGIRGKPYRIFSLYVEGECHGIGIGNLLIRRFESEAKRMGSILAHVRASIYAIQFYEKMGYVKTSEVKEYYGMAQQPMIKELD